LASQNSFSIPTSQKVADQPVSSSAEIKNSDEALFARKYGAFERITKQPWRCPLSGQALGAERLGCGEGIRGLRFEDFY
jgi:hypothetical protein